MTEQFNRESWEIYRRSDVLWEEKEMLWISSLGEHQRMLLGFTEESETDESLSPSNSESKELNEVLHNSSNSAVC